MKYNKMLVTRLPIESRLYSLIGNDNTIIIGVVVGGIGVLASTVIIVLLIIMFRWKTKWRVKVHLQDAAVPMIIIR